MMDNKWVQVSFAVSLACIIMIIIIIACLFRSSFDKEAQIDRMANDLCIADGGIGASYHYGPLKYVCYDKAGNRLKQYEKEFVKIKLRGME